MVETQTAERLEESNRQSQIPTPDVASVLSETESERIEDTPTPILPPGGKDTPTPPPGELEAVPLDETLVVPDVQVIAEAGVAPEQDERKEIEVTQSGEPVLVTDETIPTGVIGTTMTDQQEVNGTNGQKELPPNVDDTIGLKVV